MPYSLIDSILVGLLGIAVVFVVLIALSLFIMVLSKLVGLFVPKKSEKTETAAAPAAAPVAAAAAPSLPNAVKLTNVDDKTAAMIMAIVSNETDIPLDELYFKSIKALD
ncbi:OadG family protein [Feifania hominis]|uniref:OadG family protein n=1 Tax=Feifania hominis TaxID=2763660 RepID=A0A926DFJ1_9FIRM|nr:OadG family protein [Feifania hominis]MBC8537223.1 OadG family protein [Feifania hominis]